LRKLENILNFLPSRYKQTFYTKKKLKPIKI
jgi:hypothetical protein